jgi:RHS repeat-associated protein
LTSDLPTLAETGQYYYRARYYDAAVGRFISEDPIGFIAGDTNLSRYVDNSPTNFVDPSGLEAAVATATAIVETVTTVTTTTGATLLLPVAAVASIVTAVFWATPAGGGRPEDIAAVNNRPKLEPPIPQPTPYVPPAPQPYGPPEPSIPIEKMTDREIQRMLDKRLRDIQNQGPGHKNPQKVTITKEIPVTEEQLEAVDNPNCPATEEKERRKKCKSGKFLYRGDSRNPLVADPETGEIIFVNGFTSKGTNANFEKHVESNPLDTAFISTSKNIQIGIDYATNYRRSEKGGYLYEICDPGEDLGPGIRRDGLTVYNSKKFRKDPRIQSFRRQEEIAFKGHIPAKYILKSTHISQNEKKGEVFLNPVYNP